MHQCLKINDILINIFQHSLNVIPLEKPPEIVEWPETGSRTLAILARTCKTFSELALDVLWSRQPSLFPLLTCLPEDCYRLLHQAHRGSPFVGRLMKICRIPMHDDLKRVYYYAKRIRSIGFHYFTKSRWEFNDLDPRVLPIILHATCGSRRLLPHIKHLRMALSEFGGEEPTAYAKLVVGPGLQTISLSFIDYSSEPLPTRDTWKNVDILLSSSSSTLKVFTLSVEQPYPVPLYLDSPDTIRAFSNSFGHLVELNVPYTHIAHDALARIATMEYLEKLKFVVDSAEMLLFNQTTSPNHFPSLLTLSVSITHLSSLEQFLERPGFQNLRSLEVFRCENVGYWDLDSFFNIFRTGGAIPRMNSLTLVQAPLSSPPLGPLRCNVSPITTKTLVPLFSRKMKVLNISLLSTFDIDNGTLKDLAEAWPNLEFLGLFERPIERDPYVTFDGIIFLVSMCPKLSSLSLRFNAKEIGSIMMPEPSTPIAPGRNMETFDVCTSPAVESAPWIDFLPRIFPNLLNLETGWFHDFSDSVSMEPEFGLEETLHRQCWVRIRASLKLFLEANKRRSHEFI